jgi:prepilin-type N-terminal cleavage/methylation domain-containing protein
MSQRARDNGFTLIELMVVIALISLISAIGAGSWRAWASAAGQKGAATDLQTVMRQTQVRAITEGVDFCVDFDTTASAYTVYRYTCGTGMVKVYGPYTLGDSKLRLTNVQFTRLDGTSAGQITFRASGRAWPGGLTITRAGSTKTYTLDVEGLTGRVSIS